MIKRVYLFFFLSCFISCTTSTNEVKQDQAEVISNPTNKVVLSSEINWGQLNPARGDKSPKAGNIWGDRTKDVATGFLVKFTEGFSSPPHIHNVSYRAIVVKGLIHNDDPTSENMWMKPMSFWTQPKEKLHITSANGIENMAYVEIDRGPYLVKPASEATEHDEQPINVDVSNLLWLTNNSTHWIEAGSKAEISFLWENKKQEGLRGLFVKLPSGFKGKLVTKGTELHAIVLQGQLDYEMPQNQEIKPLDIGSYFTATSRAMHKIQAKTESILYIRTNDKVEVSK